jgi:fructosamine-3-kinase
MSRASSSSDASSFAAATAAGVFRKARADAPAGFFAAEAAGLRWLRVEGGPPVAGVRAVADDHLDLDKLVETRPTADAARRFGRQLATMHDAGAEAFGVLPPGLEKASHGFFGPLDQPLPMLAGKHEHFGEFLASCRLEPMLEQGAKNGCFSADDVAMVRRLCAVLRNGAFDDPTDKPARLHGDLWSGNVLWTAEGATLIDPAAHGGHRETDLAMLALFGAPHLQQIRAGYEEVHPLRHGWQQRVGLHQAYPVGMHAVFFGGGYAAQLRSLIRPYVEHDPPPGAINTKHDADTELVDANE